MKISRWAEISETGFRSSHFGNTAGRSVSRMRWQDVFARPFDRFGRLDLCSRLVMTVVEMLAIESPTEPRSSWGVVLGTQSGSIDGDRHYLTEMQSGPASPKLFSYTLPSMALGEVAIRHRVMGPCFCLSAVGESAELALWESARLVQEGWVEQVIGIACETEGREWAAAWLIGHDNAAGASLQFTEAGVDGGDVLQLFCYLEDPDAKQWHLRAPAACGTRGFLKVSNPPPHQLRPRTSALLP